MTTTAVKVGSRKELAGQLGVALRTVNRWEGLPRCADGSYDVEAVRAWRERTRSKGGRPRVNPEPDDQYRQAKAEIEQLKLRRMRRDFDAELNVMLVERARALASSFRALPRRIADKCAGRTSLEIQHVVAAEVRKILEDYSRPADAGENGHA